MHKQAKIYVVGHRGMVGHSSVVPGGDLRPWAILTL